MAKTYIILEKFLGFKVFS